MGGGLLNGGLGFLLLLLFFLVTVLISKVERVVNSVQLEFFLLKLFGLESSLDGFHVAKTTSEVFFGIEGLDSWLLFILFFIILWFLFGGLLGLRGGFLFLVIGLLFFGFGIFFVGGDVSPEAL